ncbi:MAG: hypothetical protein U0271_22195 [Polyangiaceae bacterium]
MKARRALLFVALMSSATGCTQQGQPTTSTGEVASASATTKTDAVAPAFALQWLPAPSKPGVVDGDLSEWPAMPTSSVGVRVDSDKAVLVARVPKRYAQAGIWVELSAPANPLLPLGEWQRDGTFIPYTCERVEPEAAAACKATLARYDEMKLEHEARFAALYRLDEKGIRRAVDGGGELAPIADAKVSFKDGETCSFEVELPLSALPRLSESPAQSFSLYASAAASRPAITATMRQQVTKTAAVQFQPLSSIREALFKKATDISLSYAAASPQTVEVVDYQDPIHGSNSLVSWQADLWTPIQKLGALELGYVKMGETYLAWTRDGALVDMVKLSGDPIGVVERDHAVYVVTLDVSAYEPLPSTIARYFAVGVDEAGHSWDALEEAPLDAGWADYTIVKEPGLASFGVRGSGYVEGGGPPKAPVELSWRLDEKKKKFVLKTSSVSQPSTKKPKKGR